jgi:hypothetical protein
VPHDCVGPGRYDALISHDLDGGGGKRVFPEHKKDDRPSEHDQNVSAITA